MTASLAFIFGLFGYCHTTNPFYSISLFDCMQKKSILLYRKKKKDGNCLEITMNNSKPRILSPNGKYEGCISNHLIIKQ